MAILQLSRTPPSVAQTLTASSSPATVQTDDQADLWGSLKSLTRVDEAFHLRKPKRRYTVGGDASNDISFPTSEISPFQCVIEWDGDETAGSAVTITDKSCSTYSTWVNEEQIETGSCRVLRNHSIIAFRRVAQETSVERRIEQQISFLFKRHNIEQIGAIPPELKKTYDVDFGQHTLGTGAYATVVKGLHVNEKKWYAIKLYHKGVLSPVGARLHGAPANPKLVARHLRSEVAVLQRLAHPNIVGFKQAVCSDNGICIVMELIRGGDLGAYLTKQPRGILAEPEARRIVTQMCDALIYLHGRGVVHRDLKPENVLLTEDQPPIVKIADFGMAKIVNSRTFLRTQCGTRMYMAPEMFLAEVERYDTVVDSWSLGIMVSIMLLGSIPFIDSTCKEIDSQVLNQFRVSQNAQRFLAALLQCDPQDRMSAEAASYHPWLAGPAQATSSNIHTPRDTPVPSTSTALRPEDMRAQVNAFHALNGHQYPSSRRPAGLALEDIGHIDYYDEDVDIGLYSRHANWDSVYLSPRNTPASLSPRRPMSSVVVDTAFRSPRTLTPSASPRHSPRSPIECMPPPPPTLTPKPLSPPLPRGGKRPADGSFTDVQGSLSSPAPNRRARLVNDGQPQAMSSPRIAASASAPGVAPSTPDIPRITLSVYIEPTTTRLS